MRMHQLSAETGRGTIDLIGRNRIPGAAFRHELTIHLCPFQGVTGLEIRPADGEYLDTGLPEFNAQISKKPFRAAKARTQRLAQQNLADLHRRYFRFLIIRL